MSVSQHRSMLSTASPTLPLEFYHWCGTWSKAFGFNLGAKIDPNWDLNLNGLHSKSNFCALVGEAETATVKLSELEAELSAKEELVARLEDDLLAARPSERPESASGATNGVPDLDSEGSIP